MPELSVCIYPNYYQMIIRFLIKYIFRLESEYLMFLGSKVQKGSIHATIKMTVLWEKETIKKKIYSVLKLKWKPTEEILQTIGKDIMMNDVFGTSADYGNELFKLMGHHNTLEWNFDSMTNSDKLKSSGLEAMTALIRTLHNKSTSDALNLKIMDHAPHICLLVHPMLVKIPVISMQYFLNIHVDFAFNSIRKSKHIHAESIIAYLYEILYIQQKIAMSLHEYVRLVNYAENEKQSALLINAEISAIMSADLMFSYLKATIEKIIVLIGFTYNILNLESKKTHKAKIDALNKGLPEINDQQYYIKFMLESIRSENIDELNNYRSGLLHKKGISDLQPHNYVGEKAEQLPLKKIFLVIHEQHSKNTAILLGALAMLTDELVKIDLPTSHNSYTSS